MPRHPQYLCPVCLQLVSPVNNSQINAHCDKAGQVCPCGHEPFYIAIRKPETMLKKIRGRWELSLVN